MPAFRSPVVVGAPGADFEPRPVDPALDSGPYPADTIVDGWGDLRCIVRAASVRGQLHRFNGNPRQDDYSIHATTDPPRLVVCVADGVSSATHSHLGAAVAVRFAARYIAEHSTDGTENLDWYTLFQHAAWAVVERASALGATAAEAGAAEAMMSTTLTCCVIDFATTNDRPIAHVASVGDSGAWVLNDDEFIPVTAGKTTSDAGLTSSAVTGLPRVPTTVRPASFRLENDTVLLVGSDGFGDPLGTGDGAVGRMFSERLRTPPTLLDFAHTLDFRRETFDDDRTLVAIWPTQPEAENPPPS